MKNYEKLKEILESMISDVEKFYTKEQNSAGGRLRKQLQEIKKLAQAWRFEIQDVKKGRK